MSEQTVDFEGLADWLGAMPEARNVFDITDEATTVINIDVETLAERFADRLTAAVREAERRAWDEGERHESEYLATWGQFCPGRDCNPYSDRTDALHEAADSGEEA